MVTRKFLIATCVMALICIFGILNAGYTMSSVDQDRPEPGAQNPAAREQTEGEMGKGPRSGDIGFVTQEEHNSMRRFILNNLANPNITTTREERDGRHGEKIIIQTMKGFRNTDEGRRAAGHFSIKGDMVDGRNIVYVTVDEAAYMANPKLAEHEVEEYMGTADAAVERVGLKGQEITQQQLYDAKKALADWLDTEATMQEANDLLIGIHRSVPTQLEATERDLMPDTRAYLQSMKGIRGVSGLGDQAPQEEIVVIGADQVMAHKDVFDQWLIKEGAKFSVSIIAKDQEEYEGVKGYELYREASVRVKVAVQKLEEWTRGLGPDQIITIENKTEWDRLMMGLANNPQGARLVNLNLTPGLAQAIAVGV